MNVEFLPAARRDLRAIALYIARDDPDRAVSFVEELVRRCERLTDFPRAYPEVKPGLRKVIHGRYLILYRVRRSEVLIVSVRHGARDNRRLR